MGPRHRWLRRLGRLVHARRLEREMDEEMRLHLELETEDLMRAGLPAAEARRQALARFGGVMAYREEARDLWVARWAEHVAADLRFAVRSLRRAPGFTATAVLALALGMGANATVFGVVDSIAFRPLAAREPERLVAVYGTQGEADLLPFSYASFEDLRREARAFDGVAAFTEGPVTLAGGEGAGDADAGVAWAVHASDDYFTTLGVRPALGTFFAPGDLAAPVAVLSHALWERRFGRDPRVVGRTIRVNGSALTVVGVAPAQFTGTRLFTYDPAVWLPAGLHERTIPGSAGLLTRHDAARFHVVGRLGDGVSAARAGAETDAAARRLEAAYPEPYRGLRTRLLSNRAPINPWLAPPERIAAIGRLLLAGVALVLLVACADVANLLLARMTVRRAEVAARLSLGASRRRLVQQFLTESVVLAALGAVAAIPIAALGARGMLALGPHLDYPAGFRPAAALRVFGYSALLTVGAAVAFGLAPALQSVGRRAAIAPRGGDGEAPRAGRRLRFRELLVVGQVALSVMVLVAAGLFARSLREARALDTGFAIDGALAVTLDPQLASAYDAARTRELYARVEARLARLPGVRAVGRAAMVPLDGNDAVRRVFADGSPSTVDRAPAAEYNTSAPGWFRALGTAIVEGRDFVPGDTTAATDVAVVNEVLARRLWPGGSAVGKRLRLGSPTGPLVEVVGVARTSKYRSLGEAPRPALWRDLDRTPRSRTTLVVRVAGDERAFVPAVRAAVREIDPSLPVLGLGTLREHLAAAYSAVRAGAVGALGFGILAALLAAAGIYGVVAYDVSQRRREIGIRVALGAGRGTVVRLVVARVMALTSAGAAIGLVVAAVVPTGIGRVLYGVTPRDPPTLAAAAALFCAVAAVAAVLPARRAARLDPVRALRLE